MSILITYLITYPESPWAKCAPVFHAVNPLISLLALGFIGAVIVIPHLVSWIAAREGIDIDAWIGRPPSLGEEIR